MSRHRPNYIILLSVLALIFFGSVMISSASIVMSKQISGNPFYYFRQHLWALLLGGVLMLIGYRVDYKFWRKISFVAIFVSLLLLILIFVPGIGASHGTFAKRWIDIGPINFAPTEIFKLSLIFYLSTWFDKRGKDMGKFWYTTFPFWFFLSIPLILIYRQPDTGTLITVALIAGVMYFIAGAKISHIVAMLIIGVLGLVYMIVNEPYRAQRLMIFLNPSLDQADWGYQINQALLAIGSGGFWGLGYGQSRQKFNYLPEAASDSIFAVISEELGFWGAMSLVVCYMLLAYQGYRVAEKAPDNFSKLLAVGITTWIVGQAMINIAALLSLIPLTGIPLPFISLGSSSTVMLMLASGILLNISTHTEGGTRESRSFRRRHWWSYFTGASRY